MQNWRKGPTAERLPRTQALGCGRRQQADTHSRANQEQPTTCALTCLPTPLPPRNRSLTSRCWGMEVEPIATSSPWRVVTEVGVLRSRTFSLSKVMLQGVVEVVGGVERG